jgi:hypothetical protein
MERQRLQRPEIAKIATRQVATPVGSVAEKYFAGKTFGRAESVKREGV